MEKFKLIFQVQGKDNDIEGAEYEFIDVIEKIVDAEYKDINEEDLRQEIIQSLKDKADKTYHIACILTFDSKGNEVYRDEEQIHYDFWGYMEDYNLGFKIKRTPEED